VSRFQATFPPGEHPLQRKCPHCGVEFTLLLIVEEGAEGPVPLNLKECPNCSGRLFLDSDLELHTFGDFLWSMVWMLPLALLFLVDSALWRELDKVSTVLQRHTGYSKYHLTLATLLLSILFIGWPIGSQALLYLWIGPAYLWLYWDDLAWCYRKIQSGAGEFDVEERTLADEQRIVSFRRIRVLLLIPLLFLGLIGILAGPDIHFFGLLSLYLACHFVDSTYLPPDRRRVFDHVRKFAFGES